MAKVLVVDDDVFQATILGKIVTSNGHDVSVVNSVSDAKRILGEQAEISEPFEAVLTDYILGDVETGEAVANLALGYGARIAIIVSASDFITTVETDKLKIVPKSKSGINTFAEIKKLLA